MPFVIPTSDRKRGRGAVLAVFAASLAALLLSACNTDPGGSTETEGVRLKGRVIGTSGTPIAGVVVASARTGLVDTTDGLGRYLLTAETAEPFQEEALDTLRFVKNGQPLGKVTVTSWIEDLPDLEVIQRNISGPLSTGLSPMSRIEFVLTGDGIDSLDPIVTPVYYNVLAGNYSGFAYFPPSSTVLNYAVRINVYAADSTLLARSQTVPFNSFAGDITIPAFSATNAYPVADAGRDTSLPVHGTLALSGTASDAFGGSVVKHEWSIGGGAFAESALDTTITLPSARSAAYRCVLRVTDDEGLLALDTLVVQVTNDDPALVVQADTAVEAGSTVTLHASATDGHGVARYIWDFNGDGTADDTTLAGSVSRAFPSPALHRVVVRAQDAYDGESRDTIRVFTAGVGVQWTTRTSGTTAPLTSVTWTGSQFVAVGDQGTVLTSPDGITWTPRSGIAGTVSLRDVMWDGSTLMALSSGAGGLSPAYTSPDGITWTNIRPGGDTIIGHPIGGAADSLMFVGSLWALSRSILMTADGGTTWVADTLSGGLYRFARHAGLYVGVGSGGLAASSPDGRSWTRRTTPASFTPGPGGIYDFTMMGLASTGTHAVAVGYAGHVMRSSDGMNWQHPMIVANIPPQAPGGTAGNLQGVAWTGAELVAVGNGYTVLSPDHGATWIQVASATLHSIAWNGTRLVAVGPTGSIVTSD